MSLSLKYTTPLAATERETEDFFEQKLGIDAQTLAQEYPKPAYLGGNITADVVLLTTDCLEACFELRSKGITFSQSPSYIEAGLSAIFDDPLGRRCLLLEERDYSDENELYSLT